MPYIKQENRKKYDKYLDQIPGIAGKGDLEYCITKLMKKFMIDCDENYHNLHEAVYAAQHCADEFRRRFLDKREDSAIIANGDVEW